MAAPPTRKEDEMETNLAESINVRPLRVLVGLIKEDLQRGDEAAEKAGMPYYQAAGEKMLEAKGQMPHGEFMPWCRMHFEIGERQRRRYMDLAHTALSMENGRARPFSSITDFERTTGRETRPTGGRVFRDWTPAVDNIVGKLDIETLNIRRAEMKRVEERQAQNDLALKLIDIGYKVLAKELHPDKGGSRDAMARLNQVRDRLKAHA